LYFDITSNAQNVTADSKRWSVSLSVMCLHPQIDVVLFGIETLGERNIVLGGGSDPPMARVRAEDSMHRCRITLFSCLTVEYNENILLQMQYAYSFAKL